MGRNMTFKQNDQSTCERQIKLDTRDQMQAWERKSGKMPSSYCGQCRMCVRLNEFFLPIQAKRGANKERESEKKGKMSPSDSTITQAMLK